MMKLSLMQALVGTLDDTYQSPIADRILAAWAHDPNSARYVRASANFIFTFTQHGEPYVLRFTHASERSVNAIAAEMAYVQYLAAQQVPVAQPVRSLSGHDVERVPTTLGVFHAVVFTMMPGKHYELSDLSLAQFTRWGRTVATLHQAAEHYNGAARPSVYDQLRLVEQRLPPHEGAARQQLAYVQRQLASMYTTQQTFGLIHYDLELDNLLWNDDRISMIDFDDSARYWFVADIAFALRELFDDRAENIEFSDRRVGAFLTGYRAIRMLPDEALSQLPLLLRVHNLVSFAKLLRAADAGDEPNAPAWVRELHAKLARKAQCYRDTFAAYTI